MTQTELRIKTNTYKSKNINVKRELIKNKTGSKSTDVRFLENRPSERKPNYSKLLLSIKTEYQTALIIY